MFGLPTVLFDRRQRVDINRRKRVDINRRKRVVIMWSSAACNQL